jgi:hypothetical protein
MSRRSCREIRVRGGHAGIVPVKHYALVDGGRVEVKLPEHVLTNGVSQMQIGKPQRIIIVEPLELPVGES